MFRKIFRKKKGPKNFEKPDIPLVSNRQGNEKCRGIALIVSNNYKGTAHKDLSSTDEDSVEMKTFFSMLRNYEVVIRKNLELDEFMYICEYLASLQYPKIYERIVIYFAGHGGNGCITMIDKSVCVEDLLAIFDPDKNNTLYNMARIFLIDACRGSASHARGGSDNSPAPYQPHCKYANELIAYSTLKGHVARDDKEGHGGSWTRALYTCLVLEDHHQKHLCDVLTIVNAELKMEAQTAPHQSTLTGSIYFWIEAGRVGR